MQPMRTRLCVVLMSIIAGALVSPIVLHAIDDPIVGSWEGKIGGFRTPLTIFDENGDVACEFDGPVDNRPLGGYKLNATWKKQGEVYRVQLRVEEGLKPEYLKMLKGIQYLKMLKRELVGCDEAGHLDGGKTRLTRKKNE